MNGLDSRETIARLTKDLANAAAFLTDQEARYLVDAYYIVQEDRKRAGNQVKAMQAEPNALLQWYAEQSGVLENQIKRGLDSYTDTKPIGQWLKSIYGIGPVISAGLIAHIDIRMAATAGHIWSFAGLDPTRSWDKGQKRPWNAKLKTLCWKIGQSFMKFSNADDCAYGRLYRARKAYEQRRNDSGGNAETAARLLSERRFNKNTEAYKHLTNGVLPPAQIDARARRYAVKIFLSHLHLVWYWLEHSSLPPAPFILERDPAHTELILPPNIDFASGLRSALDQWRQLHKVEM